MSDEKPELNFEHLPKLACKEVTKGLCHFVSQT